MLSRTAFVTSAGKGLGHAMVLALARAGWNVSFTYGGSEEEAKRLEAQITAAGGAALAIHCDLFDRASVLQAVAVAKQRFESIDALVHNFGPFVFERKPLADYDEDMWQRMMHGNLTNFFWLYTELIHDMRSRRFGRFVTIGYDGAGEARGWRFRAAYAAAKAGLAALTRSVAREERTFGITANMVCPGDIRGTDKMKMFDDVTGQVTEEGLRPAVGEDIARAVAWLCHADSQEVNGTVLEITGAREILARDTLGGTNRAGDRD
ncbi:SDR family oxidoreductase [Alicyclobacillus fastidiosus]|uniref:SDR family oxidoreductase n=1 Tax=Alicyclobacillus fastidiosus TaxID=392011 RepID=A0ABY6ZL84_9BACL|nr:SDR family NAD(P)-dependent oxidoreductase [Alicyclobacillus fastidiosus]WAH43684.1 SDR family oxidoreductase [Alicyclobacillus fastidiosus]GMA59891.1 putative oxidoreductase YtkK [Alicyclobacillus fastidiosus]